MSLAALSDAGELTFDPLEHRYFLDGVAIPGVTSILRDVGLIDFSHVPARILEDAQERGRLVHQALHYLAEDDLRPDSVAPEFQGYVEAGKDFRRTSGLLVYACEFRVWHPQYRYAGTVDLYGLWEGERPCLCDYKTGHPNDVAADLQLAAYAEAARALDPDLGDLLRISVKLSKDGTFEVESYDNPMDFSQFLAALTIANRRRQKQGW